MKAAVIGLVITPFQLLWNGFVLKTLWGWFVVPVFPHAPHLSLCSAIGAGLIVAMLTHQMRHSQESVDMYRLIIYEFLAPSVALLTGWIVLLLS